MKKTSTKISTLVAVSGGLAALPAAALELGAAQVNSSLGQPLRASIAYALSPHEELNSNCVSLHRGSPQNDLPMVGPANITVASGIISIAGSNAIREPLVTMRVNIRCAYTANLSREYMLFVDPAATPAQVAAPQTVATPQPAAAPQPVAASVPTVTRRRVVNREPIANASRHRVQPGETLSEIAQRIEDRPVGLWTAVGAIFDANPDAFIDDDPNKLKAGSWLLLPDFGVSAPQAVADADVFEPAAAAASASPDIVVDQAEVLETVEVLEMVEDIAAIEPVVDDVALPTATTDPANETVISIPDTVLEGPAVTSTSPNVPTANIRVTEVEESSINWLLWLAGAGIAVISAFWFFGRRGRERFDSSPIGAVAVPQRRRADVETQEIEALSDFEAEFKELSATQENVELDADLVIGTGLQTSSDVDLAQDFGFATTTSLDLELPETEAEYETVDDEYDMSVIMDATKMPRPEDVTQKDLEAIPLETSDDTLITGGDYTVSHEVDYKVLEQDYEDEFTATQALNTEISRAAAELADSMDGELDNLENTSDMSMASVTALDITAQIPANNDDDISDLDDTGVNEVITAEMPADEITIEMPAKKGKTG